MKTMAGGAAKYWTRHANPATPQHKTQPSGGGHSRILRHARKRADTWAGRLAGWQRWRHCSLQAPSKLPLILHCLDTLRPDPAALPRGAGAAAMLSRAGLALSVFEAATALIIGRKSAGDFDSGMVGRKRHRTMRTGFARLDAACPAAAPHGLDLADMAAITALDYAVFRLPDEDWRALAPRTAALRGTRGGPP